MERSPEREKARYSVTLKKKRKLIPIFNKQKISPLQEINLLMFLLLNGE